MQSENVSDVARSVVEDIVCPHCAIMESNGISHTRNCNCGHHHARHNYSGGCTIAECKCDRYDQTVAKYNEPKILESIIKDGSALRYAFADINLNELIGQTKESTTTELRTAQERVDKLKERVARQDAGVKAAYTGGE